MDIVIPSLVKGQALQNLPREGFSPPLSSWLISLDYHTPLCVTCCWAIVGLMLDFPFCCILRDPEKWSWQSQQTASEQQI